MFIEEQSEGRARSDHSMKGKFLQFDTILGLFLTMMMARMGHSCPDGSKALTQKATVP